MKLDDYLLESQLITKIFAFAIVVIALFFISTVPLKPEVLAIISGITGSAATFLFTREKKGR